MSPTSPPSLFSAYVNLRAGSVPSYGVEWLTVLFLSALG